MDSQPSADRAQEIPGQNHLDWRLRSALVP